MSAVWIEPEETSPARDLKIERETHKLEKRLCREVGRAIMDFNMIEEGDKV
ncbi:MAG: tRNA 2-thiocytidine(32) synthetase TtcA, partial [Burkholderiaceae bacterium]|nr:tRNA 2-thiocytidine(32) synthetase TtcA [Burkholderiaceae bacterium]